ncbi:MAG TPA: hypothetical protein VHL58_09295 [Thermoanaerobaculia bacterium]|nr:hypothetical protein [Thermoanaerobaculia bacterium]
MTVNHLTLLALGCTALAPLIALGARYFRTLATDSGSWTATRIAKGLAAGVITLIAAAWTGSILYPAAILTSLAAVWSRGDERELDLMDAALSGTVVGCGVALPIVMGANTDSSFVPAVIVLAIVVSAAAHFFASTRAWVRVLVLTAGVGSGLLILNASTALPVKALPWSVGIATGITPLLTLGSVFARWPSALRELKDETRLGFFDHQEIRRTVHPIRRLSLSMWRNRDARRRFVQLSTDLAMRKHQQRTMGSGVARLYQLEIMKLRSDLREIEGVERSLRAEANQPYPDEDLAPSSSFGKTNRKADQRL